jgi:hypothetical protein
MGHAEMNCEEEDNEEQGIKYGEELRASPPRRAKEINIRQVMPRIAKPLFQSDMQQGKEAWVEHGSKKKSRAQGTGGISANSAGSGHAYSPPAQQPDGLNNIITTELVTGVKDIM